MTSAANPAIALRLQSTRPAVWVAQERMLMRKIYENIDYARVGHYQSILESAGVPTLVKNLGVSGAIGEVPVTEAYPELWVGDDGDYELGMEILGPLHRGEIQPGVDWICAMCGELVPGSLGECWNCQVVRPESEQGQ